MTGKMPVRWEQVIMSLHFMNWSPQVQMRPAHLSIHLKYQDQMMGFQ